MTRESCLVVEVLVTLGALKNWTIWVMNLLVGQYFVGAIEGPSTYVTGLKKRKEKFVN